MPEHDETRLSLLEDLNRIILGMCVRNGLTADELNVHGLRIQYYAGAIHTANLLTVAMNTAGDVPACICDAMDRVREDLDIIKDDIFQAHAAKWGKPPARH
jgi:hypothetical protein